MNDLSILVAALGIMLWAALGILDLALAARRLKWYKAERGAKRTWLPTRITLPDYHPLYRWGHYNIYLKEAR